MFNACSNKRNLGCRFAVFSVNLSIYELLRFGFVLILDKFEFSASCFVGLFSWFEWLFYFSFFIFDEFLKI